MVKKIAFIAILVVLIASVFLFRGQFTRLVFPLERPAEEEIDLKEPKDFKIVAEDLQIPWEIAFLPDGDLLVTERPGTLRVIGQEERTYLIESVEHTGEGGLLGLALHPDFTENNWLYLYFTTRTDNRVERYRLDQDGLSERTVILRDIPRGSIHNGGRIVFGPDNHLYITTGDIANSNLSQDTDSLAGKILRVTEIGSVPEDNPFGNEVWSLGHRNPQGLAWDEWGRLWSTEHGPTGHDELNLIERGKNYGWPVIQGGQAREGMERPMIHSGFNTWAPSGLAYHEGSLFFSGLRGSSIYQAVISEEGQVDELLRHFEDEFGRLRAMVVGLDDHIYVATSNNDGRGIPKEGDDKIIRINPQVFKKND